MSKDTDIHSCSYFCERPACIKAQRDELRQKLDAALDLVVDLGGEVRAPEIEETKQRREDAERYRWLRGNGDTGCTEKDGYGGQTLRIGEALDAAIDAAMTAGKPELQAPKTSAP